MADLRAAIQLVIEGADKAAGDVQKVAGALEQTAQNAGKAHPLIQNFGSSLADIGKIASGVALGGLANFLGQGLASQITGSVGAVKELNSQTKQLNQIMGGSYEQTSLLLGAFQRYGVSADQAGVSLSIFAKHIQGIHDPLDELSTGLDEKGKPVKGFTETIHDMGIQLQDTAGTARPMNDVLLDVADRFKDMPAGAERTALAMQLFGRSGRDMIPVLAQGREGLLAAEEAAKSFGLVLTGENAAALKDYAAQQKTLDAALGGLRLQLGLALIPAFTAFATIGSQAAVALNTLVIPAVHALGEIIKPVAEVLRTGLLGAFTVLRPILAPVADLLGKYLAPALAAIGAAITVTLLPAFGALISGAVAAGAAAVAAFLPVAAPFVAIGIAAAVLKAAWDNDFGGIQEKTQTVFAVVGDLFHQASDFILPRLELAMDAVRAIWVAFTEDAGAMGVVLDVIRKVFGDSVADFLQPFIQWFMDAIPGIQDFVSTVVGFFVDFAQDIRRIIDGDVVGGFEALIGHLVDYEKFIWGHLLEWAADFVAWVGQALPPMMEALGGLLRDLGAWLLDPALPAIIEKLGEWAGAFVAWVGPQIPPLLRELGLLLGDLTAWVINDALPAIALKLGEWAGAFIAWVGDVVSQLPDALGTILATIANWVTGGGLAAVQDQATTVGQGFIQGIIDGIGNFLPNLLKTVGDAATTAIGAFSSGFATGLTGGSGQRGPGGELSDAQFGQAVRAMGFTENEIKSICGPIAAEGVARALGEAVSLPNIVHAAQAAGLGNYAGDVGTYGNPGEQGILKQLGISSQIVGESQAKQLATSGTPVIINTNQHFFLAQGYDPSTGQFDTGATGQVFRGGGRNLTLGQIGALGGGLLGFIAPTAQKGGDISATSGLREQMRAYIRNAAAKNGIDPNIADAVFSGESVGYTQFVGDKGSSFGPAQLHVGGLAGGGNAVAGLGNTFMQQTGLDPRDLTTWPQQIDFSLQQAAQHGWAAWHAAAAQGITDWQGIGTVAKDFVPTLDQTDRGFTDLAAAADDSSQTISDAFDGVVTDAQTFARKFGIPMDAASKIIDDHGQVARIVLGESIPGSFVLTDQAVERFADAMGVNWDEARAILSEGGHVSELVMGAGGVIPTAASDTVDALTNTGQAHVDLAPKITNVHTALSTLATGGFGAANKAQSEFARDAATQVSFVLQQLNDKMPDLIANIQAFTDKLLAIPRDISVNISTSGAVEAVAGAGGGGGGDLGFDLSTPASRDAARAALGSGFVVTDTGILNQSTGQVVQGLQHGGYATAGRTYLVGEAGPELFTPSASGHVMPGGGGLDYRQLAEAIVAALSTMSITMDGQRVAAMIRGQNTRYYQMSPAGGVGGV